MKYRKPYKDDIPENTINKIRGILNGLGIIISEHHKPHFQNRIHSCGVKIANSSLNDLYPGISANGKGINIEYAFASAYAEFIERLQNGILFRESNDANKKNLNNKGENLFIKRLQEDETLLEFYYDPDEKIFEAEAYIEREAAFLEPLFFTKDTDELKSIIIGVLGHQNITCVPFYDESKKRIVYLPLELFFHCYGTNGMCAGNTPQEALVHGICEIIERYVIAQVYHKKLCPPIIPLDSFQDTSIIELVNELKKVGLKVIIKDFSLGIGLPVIGVVVVDTKNHTYNVKAASDPNPSIALERSLTELYQTSKEIKMNSIQGWKDNLTTDEERFFNFKKIRYNSSGHWHKNIFDNSFSYEFKGLNFDLGRDHKSDLEYLKKCIQHLGGSLYIRDVSFLGFSSFYIVIPQLSHIHSQRKEDFYIYNDFYALKKHLNRVDSLSQAELEKLVLSIERCCKLDAEFWEKQVQPSFVSNSNKALAILDKNLFLSMAFYKLDNLKQAIIYLDNFLNPLKNTEIVSFKYYFACRDYFLLKQDGASNAKMVHILNTFYEGGIVKEVITDLGDPKKVFQYQELPSCYECEHCKISKDCKFFDIAKIIKKVQARQAANPINQMKVSDFM